MKKSGVTPPRLFLRFFQWFCDPQMLYHIEGDLIEVYQERTTRTGKKNADLRFIIDVILLFRPGIIRPAGGYKHFNNKAMIRSYFKIGWRNLLRNKGYSLINIGGLAAGIAVTLLIGLWINDELSFNKYNKNYDRIAQVLQHVTNNGEIQTWSSVPFPLAEELRTNYGGDFENIVMVAQRGDHMLTMDDKKFVQKGGYLEKGASEILSLDILAGSGSLDEPTSILLSSATATAFFGNKDPINELIKIDDMPLTKVTGIYKDFPRNSAFANLNFIAGWDFLYANSEWMKTIDDPWRPNFITLLVELKDHAEFAIVSGKIRDAKLKKINPQLARKKPALFLLPMNRWHLYSEFKNGVNVGGAIQYVWMFGIIGTFVLLLACINFMNLSTARNEKRAKEVGIRKTVGSIRRQLIFQFLSESLLTVLLAFVLAILIAQLALPIFNEVANKEMSILWTNPFFWGICAAFVLFVALLAGSYPAFFLSSIKPVKVLKGTFKAGRYAALPRKTLVVLQFTVSVTLIIGTIVVYQQIQYAKNRPVGYSRNNLISIPTMNASIHDHFNTVKDELIKTGAATAIAESESPTTAIWNSTSGFSWKGKDPDLSIDFGVVSASIDFGKTIDWKVIDGRDFSRDFLSDSSALILNEAAVNYMGLKNPVGELVTWWGNPSTVIGVVENMITDSPYDEIRPIIYGLSAGRGNIVLVKLNPELNTRDALEKITSTFKKFNTEQPFEFQFVNDEYAKKFGDEERVGKLSGFFATLAIIISCLGIFGLASFTAEQRTKEIGIRKVLGASVLRLWHLLSRDFVFLVILSWFLAAPVSYYFLHQWLSEYKYRTDIQWWVFVVGGTGALIITLLIVSFQALKAAIANPVKSLRSE